MGGVLFSSKDCIGLRPKALGRPSNFFLREESLSAADHQGLSMGAGYAGRSRIIRGSGCNISKNNQRFWYQRWVVRPEENRRFPEMRLARFAPGWPAQKTPRRALISNQSPQFG
jgi:hypothetical protein